MTMGDLRENERGEQQSIFSKSRAASLTPALNTKPWVFYHWS